MLKLIIMAISNESSGYELSFIAHISLLRAILGFTQFYLLPRFYPITQGKTG